MGVMIFRLFEIVVYRYCFYDTVWNVTFSLIRLIGVSDVTNFYLLYCSFYYKLLIVKPRVDVCCFDFLCQGGLARDRRSKRNNHISEHYIRNNE